MKYQSSNTKLIYDIDFDKKSLTCPECSNSRKKSGLKVLRYYSDTNRAFCFHCNTTFFEYKPYVKEKEYNIPEWKNITKLTDKSVKWFTGRMISQSTLNLMKIYSDIEYMPQFSKEIEVICFPYFQDGKLKNIKYRGAQKSFKLYSGAELLWYNFDALKDNKEIIIVEGEIDALTWIENKFLNVVSVPNGANSNLEYLDSSIQLFENIETVYLATDNDGKGIELRDELIRRIGHEKCRNIIFKECKDSNEYYCKYGLEFKNLLKESKQVEIKGIIDIDSIYDESRELFEHGIKPGLKIGNCTIDELITWETSRFAVITGRPTSGKSEFVDYLVCKLNLLHGWKCAFFTPENYPLKFHYAKLHEKISGKKFDSKVNTVDFDSIYEHISNNFFYILNEDDMSIDFILNATKILIKKHGIKVLVVDPFNVIDHQFSDRTTETQYISKLLNKIVLFCRVYDILFILVAHPHKLQKGDKPTMYTINGSSHFYNKSDYGIIIERLIDKETGVMGNEVEINIQKVKFKHLGRQGVCDLNYNYNNGRYEEILNDVNSWDNRNWLQLETSIIEDMKAGILPDNEFMKRDEIPF